MKRIRIGWCCLLAMASAAPCLAASRPNIVVILADDQGWGDLSINGNTNLRTPNIDGIGRAGAVLDRFFVCAVCAPTRAEFLTGRYHPRGGVNGVSTGFERLNLDERTIADAFRAAGYATGAFGKWHNGSQWPYHPNARGFQDYQGFTSGHWGEYYDAPLEHNGKFTRGTGFIADDFTNRAIEFIDKHKSEPFFCYLTYNTPHSPFCVPDAYWNRFKDRWIDMWGQHGAHEKFAVTRCVLAMCENIDDNVGRILKRLDDLKLADDTIVIYFSDNGPNSVRWNGGMKGQKGTVDEGGVRSPFLIRWPGKIKAGTVVREITGAIDMLPTLTSLAEVKPAGTKRLDGLDLSPLLLGKGDAWPDRVIFNRNGPQVSARSQRYRLDPTGALFDMVEDPGQTRDISGQKPEIKAELTKAVASWRKDVFGSASAPTKAEQAKARLQNVSTDPRPFTVGYAEFPLTPLPARDGMPRGGIRRSAAAPNCSYFTNWKSLDDSIEWHVDVHTSGDYEAVAYYTCPAEDVGSTVELSFGSAGLTAKVETAWDPKPIDNQDRVPRKGESYLKEFRPLKLGTIKLKKGEGILKLEALRIPGKSVMDVRMITLELKP